MKQVLKIVSLSFLVVIAAFGLAVGGMYLFGGFQEKNIYANDITFSTTSVISSESFGLKITTNTEGVNKNKLRLSVLTGGDSVIDFPSQVEIGEVFTIKPKKKADGSNFGGNATLIASYDEIDANPAVVAKCEILIDVPIKSLTLNIPSFTTTPNQIIPICNKDAKIETVFGVNPARALMPYAEYGNQVITDVTDKAIYLELVDEFGSSLDAKVAQFVVNDIVQQTNLIEVNYTYKDVDFNGRNEIVFEDNIAIISKTTQSKALLNAYVYSTYKEQNSNTTEGTLQFNKTATKTNNLGFTIGNYEIIDMNISTETEEILIKEESNIYLNTNSNIGDNDINLGLNLTTGSQGIEAGDYYLLNTYISIEDNDYVQIKNLNNQSDTFAKAEDGDKFAVKFNGISTEKDDWGWVLKIDNFKAYSDYVSNNKPIVVWIRYYHEDDDIKEEPAFEKSFKIIPKIIEVDKFTVNETLKTKVESKKEKLQLSDANFTYQAPDGKILPNNYKINYLLSFTENFKNGKTTVSTVPNKLGKYKVFFDIVFGMKDSLTGLDFNPNIHTSWASIVASSFYQNGVEIDDIKSFAYDINTPVKVELIVDMIAQPTSSELFVIKSSASGTPIEDISIYDYQVKFYDENAQEGDRPYLSIDNVKYDVHFDYFKVGTYNYLRINEEDEVGTYYLDGIGSFYITAQAVYVEDNGETFWLDKSINILVEAYENLANISATKVYLDGVEKYDGKFNKNLNPIIEDSGYTEYIYITSNQLDALTNYINAGAVNVYAEQVLTAEQKESFNGIENINKDTIKFGNAFIPVEDSSGNVIGYKISYTVGEVNTINANTEIANRFKIIISVNAGDITVDADFHFDDSTTQKELVIDVQDIVMNSAVLTYNNNKETLNLQATVNGSDFKYVVNNSSDFNADQLKYALTYNITDLKNYTYDSEKENDIKDKIKNTINTLAYEFVPVSSTSFSFSGLSSFEFKDTGVGGFNLKNFPYVENGIKVKLRIYSGSYGIEHKNAYYKWNGDKFVETQYPNLFAELYLNIVGLNIELTPNTSKTVIGVKDSNLNVFGEDGLFAIKINDTEIKDAANIRSLIEQEIFTTYINKDYLFNKDDNKLVWKDGIRLTFAKDLISSEEVDFNFYVGSTKNAITINGKGGYTQKIESPFVVNVVNGTYDDENKIYNVEVSAPSENITLATYSILKADGTVLTSDELENVAKDKIKSETITFELVDYDSSCGVTDPVIKNGNLLSFKATPLEVYSIKVTYTLSVKTGQILAEDGVTLEDINEVKIVTILVKVRTLLQESDIQIGTKVEAVEGESEEYYYIEAGKDYSVKENDIVFSGVLNDSIVNNKVETITLSFADVDDYNENTPEKYRVYVDKHMSNTSWDGQNISLSSSDLKDEKTIIVTITVVFANNGGKLIYTKELVVKPNVGVEFGITSLRETEEINLLNYFTKVNLLTNESEKLNLSSVYESGQTNNIQYYCKKSFDVDTNTVFKDNTDDYDTDGSGNDIDSYPLSVISGAASACGGKTTVGFYYIVNNSYTLYFEFEVEIVAI